MEVYVLAKLPWKSLTNLRWEGWSLWRDNSLRLRGEQNACKQLLVLAFYLTAPFYLNLKKKKNWVWNPKASFFPELYRERSQHSQAFQRAQGYRTRTEGCPNPAMHSTMVFSPWPHTWLCMYVHGLRSSSQSLHFCHFHSICLVRWKTFMSTCMWNSRFC